MSRDHPQGWFWTCGHCGKRAFPNRRSAKAAARQVRRTQGHEGPPTSVYRCSGDEQAFHWGHDGQRAVAILEEERVARTGTKRAASATRAPRHVALHEPRPDRAGSHTAEPQPPERHRRDDDPNPRERRPAPLGLPPEPARKKQP